MSIAIARLLGRDPERRAAHEAYVALVEQARRPVLYARHGVPDTLDGRFELIALHAFLVIDRLSSEAAAARFRQILFDVLFADMDRSLREMGNGDLSVGTQVKRMATGFYGRSAAYRAGLDGTGDLGEALRRNLFGTVPDTDPLQIEWFARYLSRQRQVMLDLPTADVLAGRIVFIDPDLVT